MEFLVNIRIAWADSVSEPVRQRLRDEEVAMAAELGRRGTLVRMWRVPGRRENWGLWRAADATELHSILSQLPIFPYMDIIVHSLGRHAVDPGDYV